MNKLHFNGYFPMLTDNFNTHTHTHTHTHTYIYIYIYIYEENRKTK